MYEIERYTFAYALYLTVVWPHLYWNRNIPSKLDQYHSCWYLGYLGCKVIRNQAIDYPVHFLQWGRISTLYGISISRNDRKWKCIFCVSKQFSPFRHHIQSINSWCSAANMWRFVTIQSYYMNQWWIVAKNQDNLNLVSKDLARYLVVKYTSEMLTQK